MIVASLLLVIAAAVTLLVGLLNREVIEWVYASIACCLLAGLLLTVGVLRSRPSRKPVLQSGGDGTGASWAGASQWAGANAGATAATGVLERDDESSADSDVRITTPPAGDDEPTRTDLDQAPSASQWAPAAGQPGQPGQPGQEDTGEIAAVRVVDSPSEPEPSSGDTSDDVVVVPKPSSRGGMAAGQAAQAAAAGAGTPTTAPAAASSSSSDAAKFEEVLAPIAGVGPAKRTALYQHFGTYRKLRAATPEKLAEVSGISRTLADRIHQTLHSG